MRKQLARTEGVDGFSLLARPLRKQYALVGEVGLGAAVYRAGAFGRSFSKPAGRVGSASDGS